MPVGPFSAGASKIAGGGFFGKLSGALGALGGSAFGKSLGASTQQAGSDLISNQLVSQGGRILGIPTADDKLLNTFNKLYPGTNPWERLGSSGSGVGARGLGAQLEREKLRTSEKIARINARAQVTAAGVSVGRNATVGGTAHLEGKDTQDWDTQVSVRRDLVDSKIALNYGLSEKARQEANAIAQKLAPELKKLTRESQLLMARAITEAHNGNIKYAESLWAEAKSRADVKKTELGYLTPAFSIFDNGSSIPWQDTFKTLTALLPIGIAGYGSRFVSSAKSLMRATKKRKPRPKFDLESPKITPQQPKLPFNK